MPDLHPLAFLGVPTDILVALDYRPFRFALQPYHYLVRMAHILSMAAFFGGIALLDLRLMGVRAGVPLKAFAAHVLPWLYGTFGVAILTGIALFLYDPVHVGSHAYFSLKLILVGAGLANATLFHRTGYVAALATESMPPLQARWAGSVSLAIWCGVLACSCLNVEAAPKLLLR